MAKIEMKKSLLFYQLVVFSNLFFYFCPGGATPTTSNHPWTGLYLGTKAGAVFSHFNTNTTTTAGAFLNNQEANSINAVGYQQLNPIGFLSGFESGYNWQFDRFLLGLSADIQSLSSHGETHSGAVPDPTNVNNQFVITSYANNNWLFTLKPRLGIIKNNWLFYTTGGLGLTFLQSDFLFTNNQEQFESQRVRQAIMGYVIGGGVETNLTNHISLKTEYFFGNFNSTKAYRMGQNLPASQTFSNQANFRESGVTLGLNYHVDNESFDEPLLPHLFDVSHWNSHVGLRLFTSSGVAGAPQPLLNSSNIGNLLASRLTFNHLTAVSEEVFARTDHESGVFFKGYLGAGSVTNGQLNDEDFPAEDAYSNTLSHLIGNLSYATLDMGYSFLKTATAKTGLFIGYNYYAQHFNVYDCRQLAGAGVCIEPSFFANFLVLTEDEAFNSLRIGLSSQTDLSDRLTLTADVAYIPAIAFNGIDMHNVRQLIGPEHSNDGDGAMLEATLDYQLSDSWNAGIGGRYWMWNMHSGSVIFDFLGDSETFLEPARFNTNRYGGFLQISYRPTKLKNTDVMAELVDWTGLFVGGNLGGAWAKSHWSDPFGSTPGLSGFTNVAGFGDQIPATGPLAGGNLYLTYQAGSLVYGVGGSLSATDIRGENTLFSGLGGINAQTKTNYLSTMAGRVGTVFHHSLFYVDGGAATLNTQYTFNGNTGILTLGAGSQTINTWGWTGGVGAEYALSPRWTSSVEYNYIDMPNQAVSLPTVALMNTKPITAHQVLSLFKLSVNYKLI